MNSTLNLQGDLPILYILLAILILLALLAAIGAWVRGGGLKREDAETLFSEANEKHREELLRLETALEQSRKESAEALAKTQNDVATRMRELNEQMLRSRSELETAVSQITKKHSDSISDELQSVTRTITESERRTGTSLEGMNSSLQSLQGQVKMAGDAVTRSVSEIVRQQREQKAQSTIQLCEALITSLGTLKSTITNQISHSGNVIDADQESAQEQQLSEPSPWISPFEDESETSTKDNQSTEANSESMEEHDDNDRLPFEPNLAPGTSDPEHSEPATESSPFSSYNSSDMEAAPTAEEQHHSNDIDPHTRDTNHDDEGSESNSDSERDRSGF